MSEEELFAPDNEVEKAINNDLVVVSEVLPDNLIVLPILDRPIFPGIVLPLFFSGEKSLNAIKSVIESQNNIFGVVLVREINEQDMFNSSFYTVGTALKIYKVIPISEDSIQVVAQGIHRFRFIRSHANTPILKWEVKYYYEPNTKPDEEQRAYAMAVMSSAKSLLKLNPLFQEQLKMLLANINFEKPGYIMDLIASVLTVESTKLQSILEAFDLYERGKTLLLYLKEEIEVHKLQEKIKSQIDEKMATQQKDFFLKEQLKIIKKELGIEKDDKSSEVEKIEGRIKNLILPEETAKVVQSELDKLKMLEPTSPEYNVVRTYLDVITQLPWGVYSEDIKDIKHARQILNDDHYGLDDVKSRILEFISTIIKRGKLTGSNILLVGPPGVGKTSVGKSIASALGRKFYRFSLGGMRDEAEIKGHRRTYIGAMPGKLIESIKRAGTSNPVIMLDEIDKIGKSFQGDPASALLEVLDPEQNQNFLDHYLDVRFDLSNVLFVATANQLDTIPSPLLDRMEIIRLSGYILEEKTQIAKKYLISRQLENHGLTIDEVDITDKALVKIIDRYAREAGVRKSRKSDQKESMRKATLKSAEGENQKIKITPENVEEYLGKEIFSTEELYNKDIPGVTLGLAYTAMGGTTLYIEANAIHGKSSGFKQTGQLGDVMRESSEIAYSFIRSMIGKEDNLKNYFDENFIHLHVPAGATPKDGPSAGITMALALHSLATQKIVRNNIAMTGELTLTGKVLPIGGVREKIIAARRVGIFEIILPHENQKDFDELPNYIKEGIKVHYADYFKDVLEIAYV